MTREIKTYRNVKLSLDSYKIEELEAIRTKHDNCSQSEAIRIAIESYSKNM